MSKGCATFSLLFLLTATIYLILGITTPNWRCNTAECSGLWESCILDAHSKETTHCYTIYRFAVENVWFQVVRALEVISCVASAMDVALLIIYIVKEDAPIDRHLMKAVMANTLITGLLTLTGVFIFAIKTDGTLRWSLAFASLGGLLTILIIFPLAFEFRKILTFEQYEAI